MNCAALAIFMLTCAAATGAAPPTNNPPKLPPGDRFLFVVDTSAGMGRVAEACRRTVFELIWSGLGGYMQPGDTYGLWTFNDKVERSRLPMQVWRSNSVELASVASRFLRDQPYENSSHPEAALATLKPTVALVQDLVVILITDGRAPIAGTPFDAAIQAACKQRAAEARKLRQPLLVVLVARGGQWVRWSVHLPGETLDLPQRVSSAVVVAGSTHSNAPAAIATPASLDRASVRTAPTNAVVLTPIQAPPATVPNQASPATNPVWQALAVTPPPPTEPLAEPAAAETISSSNIVLPTVQPEQPADPSAAPTQPAESTLPPDRASQPPASAPQAQPSSAQAQATPVADVHSAQVAREPATVPPRTAAPPVVLRPKNTAIVAAPAQPAAAGPTSAPLATPLGNAPERAVPVPGFSPETVAARERVLAPAGAPSAAAAPSPGRPGSGPTAPGTRGFGPWVMLAIGLGLLSTAWILTFVFLRRIRPPSRHSIISESLDRTGGRSTRP